MPYTVWGTHHPNCCPDIVNFSFKQRNPKTQPSAVQKNRHYSNKVFSIYKCQHSYKRQLHLRVQSTGSKQPFDFPVDFCCQKKSTSPGWGTAPLIESVEFFHFFKKENHQGLDFLLSYPLQGCPPWAQLAQSPLRSGCWKQSCFAPSHQHKSNHTRLKTIFHSWK